MPVLISDYSDVLGVVANNVVVGIKTLYEQKIPQNMWHLWTYKETLSDADKAKRLELLKLVDDIEDVRKRFLDFLAQWKFPKGIEMFSPINFAKSFSLAYANSPQAKMVYDRLKLFEKEIDDLGKTWSKITGQKQPPGTVASPDIKIENGAIDYIFTGAKWAAIIIGIYYGGKFLNQYIEKSPTSSRSEQ